MKVEEVELSRLIPYSFNNKRHPESQVDHIANSIKEFGFNQPIVVDEDFIVLVGHGRLAAAKKLGLETAPVYRLTGLTEAQKKAYRILDNKLSADAEWDFENIKIEIEALEDLGFDVDEWAIKDLLPNEPDEGAELDLQDEPPIGDVTATLTFASADDMEDALRRIRPILKAYPNAKITVKADESTDE
jgi:ParB family transcriptional regulator, chromosome partitioning protein